MPAGDEPLLPALEGQVESDQRRVDSRDLEPMRIVPTVPPALVGGGASVDLSTGSGGRVVPPVVRLVGRLAPTSRLSVLLVALEIDGAVFPVRTEGAVCRRWPLEARARLVRPLFTVPSFVSGTATPGSRLVCLAT